MVRPFEWGLEHIGGDLNADEPRAFLRDYSAAAIEHSREWYEPAPATDYNVDGEGVLTFTSAVRSPFPENNTVYGQIFRGKKKAPAVLLLPNWNAKWHGQRGLCEWIQRMGITVLKMSMPYHDRRMAKGHERADRAGCKDVSSLARATGLHEDWNFGDEYRFFDRLYHDDA